ncbi:HMG (high mobility group) box protein [Klebsormidium nitens]|uniref:HMG (High mobility group) box protein n=1 Tax=Klebsormidium nitens TaxID=105231 RepID=A0A1Y1IX89_KLENI|nr:HMG (high mobility group) box protein [Klebsormidium nitens]|eukprot:GAQ92888.1 HMG (high mobility group) box protein [Klebsormidium nitens]
MSDGMTPNEASPTDNIGDGPSRAQSNAVAESPSSEDKKRKANPLSRKSEELEAWEGPGLKRIKKRLEGVKEEDLPELEPLEVLGTTVQALVVAKFDRSYLLEVQIGREKLHGVLYHAPPPEQSYPFIPPPVMTTRLALEGGQVVMKNPPRKVAEEKLKRDRNAPKLARTCYNFFFTERGDWRAVEEDDRRGAQAVPGDGAEGQGAIHYGAGAISRATCTPREFCRGDSVAGVEAAQRLEKHNWGTLNLQRDKGHTDHVSIRKGRLRLHSRRS